MLIRLIAMAVLLSVLGCIARPMQTRIAFGSCSDQAKPQPVLRLVVALRPAVFVFLGDNIYGDSDDPAELKATRVWRFSMCEEISASSTRFG